MKISRKRKPTLDEMLKPDAPSALLRKKTGNVKLGHEFDMKRARLLYLAGWTDKRVAEFFGVTADAIHKWKRSDPALAEAIREWKRYADAKVELSLYQRAVGFEYDEVTYEKTKPGLAVKLGKKGLQEIKAQDAHKVKVTTKLLPGDVSAQKFWLTNRKAKRWREKQEHLIGSASDEEFRNAFFGLKPSKGEKDRKFLEDHSSQGRLEAK